MYHVSQDHSGIQNSHLQIVVSFGWFHTWDTTFSPETSGLALFSFQDVKILEARWIFFWTAENYPDSFWVSSQILQYKVNQSTIGWHPKSGTNIPINHQSVLNMSMLHLSRLMSQKLGHRHLMGESGWMIVKHMPPASKEVSFHRFFPQISANAKWWCTNPKSVEFGNRVTLYKIKIIHQKNWLF